MISHEHKCVFVHCHKCAGESIEQALFGKADKGYKGDPFLGSPEKHFTAAQYIDKYGIDLWQNYFTFSFVRNPWDRVISWIRFRDKRLDRKDPITPGKIRSELKNKYILKNSYHHLLFKEDQIQVNFIGRFENLIEDFNRLCNSLGLPNQELPHHNKTTHQPYWEYYDDTTIALVQEIYQKDIEYFEYQFRN